MENVNLGQKLYFRDALKSTHAILRLQVGGIMNAPVCGSGCYVGRTWFLSVGRVTVLRDTDPAPPLYAVSVSLCALLAASARSRYLAAREY